MKAPATEIEPSQEDDREHCRALGKILDQVSDKWTVMVVGVLSKGPTRFNAIMREIGGVSHRMLTLTLRNLERDGLVTRTAYATIPPKVEYELTDVGRSLIAPLEALRTWVVEHSLHIDAAREKFDRRERQSDATQIAV
ncbi:MULTISPECIES: winged helix-turn-helix transcriptional regulator [Burkholderia]|uniref:winged helix-turn-helix transcriptional regulator n=1 Tax=Burkholderia TaxID=32008 RepID=UPI00064F44B6|nr:MULTISPECIES: helix-turn-helix domain-containing protein [Burkholderia]KML07898.1 HxlR family transcriptional regulator [Burkholderia cepacia]KMN62507.1 HxlR family transcriptional regulator [Burkholderia sp. LK4]